MQDYYPATWKRWFRRYTIVMGDEHYTKVYYLRRFRLRFWLLNEQADGLGCGLRPDWTFLVPHGSNQRPRWLFWLAYSRMTQRHFGRLAKWLDRRAISK